MKRKSHPTHKSLLLLQVKWTRNKMEGSETRGAAHRVNNGAEATVAQLVGRPDLRSLEMAQLCCHEFDSRGLGMRR